MTIQPVFIVVVTERVGAVIEGLAPGDVQRLPARVEGYIERYELLHVLARIDCIDWERTRASAWVNEDLQQGTLASLAPWIDRNKMEEHVVSWDMTLKTEGIVAPRIFRVVDWDLYAIVTEEIKVALERERVRGVSFQAVRT